MSDRPSKFNCHKNCLQKIKVTYVVCKIKTYSDSANLFDNNRSQNRENPRKLEVIIAYYWWTSTSILVNPPSKINTRMSALNILQLNRNLIYLWFVLPRINTYKTKLYINLWKYRGCKIRLVLLCAREVCNFCYATLLTSALYIWQSLWMFG